MADRRGLEFGALFLGAVALVATAHLTVDLWQVVSRVSSLAALRTLLVALAVIFAGAAWTIAVARLAGSTPRRVTIATWASLMTLIAVRVVIAIVQDGVLSGEPGVYDRQAAELVAGGCCPWDEPISRPPGYVFLLAGAYAIFGQSAAAGEALNIAFAVATGLSSWSWRGGSTALRPAPSPCCSMHSGRPGRS